MLVFEVSSKEDICKGIGVSPLWLTVKLFPAAVGVLRVQVGHLYCVRLYFRSCLYFPSVKHGSQCLWIHASQTSHSTALSPSLTGLSHILQGMSSLLDSESLLLSIISMLLGELSVFGSRMIGCGGMFSCSTFCICIC